MPPVTKAGGSAFQKDVEFVAKDDDEQVAAGIVMVPDKADLQHDFAREETIRTFANQFETFYEAGEAGGGIMHAVFPDGWMDLERNEVLDEAEEIGGTEVPAGAWVQEWRIENEKQWGLIKDDILSGYSIGAIQVEWDGPYDQDDDEVDDVEIPEDLDDALVWELEDGIIREVSNVDIPAVPDAQILEAKADADKRLGDYLGDQDSFLEEAMERGHSEADAERLWDVLNAAVEVEGSNQPGKDSVFARAGKAFLEAFSATGGTAGSDDGDGSEALGRSAEKEGRTLSTQNRESLFATIDASLDVLQDAGVDHGMTRFTDREDTAFDLSEHSARTWSDPDDDEDEDEETDVSPTNNAAGGDTPADDGGQEAAADMTDNDDTNPDDGETKSLAEENAEQISELTSAVETLTETLSGPEQKTAEIEIGDETYEVPEAQVKAALGVDEDGGVDVADAIESLKSEVDVVNDRVDAINRQSGRSDQIDAATGDETDDDDPLEGLGKALS